MTSDLKKAFLVVRYDLKIFFRYKINTVWLIMSPIVYMATGFVIYNMMGSERFLDFTGGASSGEVYSVIGYSVFSLANYCWQCGYKVENEITMGTVKANFLLPIPKATYLYGLSMSSLVSAGVFTMIIFLICAVWTAPSAGNLFLSLLFLAVSMSYFLGIALIVSSLSLVLKKTGNLANLVTFVMQVVTGLMIPVRILPPYLQVVSYVFPTTWAIDSVRCSLMGAAPLIPLSRQFIILVFASLGANFAGVVLLKKAEQKLQMDDSLDIY